MMRQRDFWSVLAGQLTGIVLAHRELEIGNLVSAAVPLPTAATRAGRIAKRARENCISKVISFCNKSEVAKFML